jgi:hypothetical protein
MGIALFGLDGLTAPLRSLLGWLVRAPGARRAAGRARAGKLGAGGPAASGSRPANSLHAPAAPRRPLRVVRVVEASRPAAGAGRMFISGRMADVCAELDRLAAMEAAAG